MLLAGNRKPQRLARLNTDGQSLVEQLTGDNFRPPGIDILHPVPVRFVRLDGKPFGNCVHPGPVLFKTHVQPMPWNIELEPALVLKAANTPLTGIEYINAGFEHSTAIDENGNIWVWGRNQYAELGLGKDYPDDQPRARLMPVP